MAINSYSVKGTYDQIGEHIYVYFSYPPNNTIKQILTMNYAYRKNVKGRTAWVLANNTQNLQLVKSLSRRHQNLTRWLTCLIVK